MRSSLATFLDDYRRHGDAAAIVVYRGNRRLISTWNEIADLADGFAAELVRRQIAMGDRVVIWGQNGLEWMGAFFGCVQRGVIAVPLDPAGALDFANRVIVDTRPCEVVGDRTLLQELAGDCLGMSFEDFARSAAPGAGFQSARAQPYARYAFSDSVHLRHDRRTQGHRAYPPQRARQPRSHRDRR